MQEMYGIDVDDSLKSQIKFCLSSKSGRNDLSKAFIPWSFWMPITMSENRIVTKEAAYVVVGTEFKIPFI